MFVLSEVQRLAVIAGCVGLLLFVIILTLCVVCPACWINKRLQRRKPDTPMSRKSSSKKIYGGVNEVNCFLEREPPPPYECHEEAEMTNCTGFLNFNRKLTPTNSNSSASDSVTGIPLPFVQDDIEIDVSEEAPPVDDDHGHVSIGISYARIDEREEVMGHLTIIIKEGIDLSPRLYGGRIDPYFLMQLFKVKGRRKNVKPDATPLCELKTPVARRTQNPVFNETFVIPFYPQDLKKCILKLTAWDNDRLANDSPFGECTLALRDVPVFEDTQEHVRNIALKETKQNNGQILLGLCYLPTAERMTVAVLKANNLKALNDNRHPAVYVQAMAIYGGKVLERRKTSCHPGTAFPVFNEMLMFDVPYTKLEHVVLLVVVRSSSDCMSPERSSPRKDPYVGKVAVGSCCTRNGLHHWNAMKNSPRRQIIQWHILR